MTGTEFYNHVAIPYEEMRKSMEGTSYRPIDWREVFKPRLFGGRER